MVGDGGDEDSAVPRLRDQIPTASDLFTGYNYNTSYIGHGVNEARVAPTKAARVRRPSEIALFGDGEYYGGTNKYMRAPLKDVPLTDGDSCGANVRGAGTQAFRHRGRTNVVFCDGHGDSLKDRFHHNRFTDVHRGGHRVLVEG